jgi:hypothetical protein
MKHKHPPEMESNALIGCVLTRKLGVTEWAANQTLPSNDFKFIIHIHIKMSNKLKIK